MVIEIEKAPVKSPGLSRLDRFKMSVIGEKSVLTL
jgi:hypothetical protein